MPSSFDLKDDSGDALATLLTQKRAERKAQERTIEAQRAAASQEQANKLAMLFQQDQMARKARQDFGSDVPVNYEGVSIGARDPFQQITGALKMRDLAKRSLTPAQEAAEKKAGQDIEQYTVGGGKSVMEKNAEELMKAEQDLQNRDWYDRTVGGTLAKHPTLMGLLAPTEKARMDKVQGTAVGNIKATDSAPTQVLIDQTTSRAYDPRATNDQNAERISVIKKEAADRQRQMDSAVRKYQSTGYATIGSEQPPTQQPERTVVKTLRNKNTKQIKVIYSDGTEEIK